MLASTKTPPFSSQSLPSSAEYVGVSATSNPPYAFSSVALLPSIFQSFGCTTKYGTFVPSLLVASNCSTVSFDPSNRGGSLLATVSVPLPASPKYSVLGVRKPVTERKKRSSVSLVEAIRTEMFSGRSNFCFDQPSAPGV